MIVYHGTGVCHLDGLLTSAPRRTPRSYLKSRQAFSTTTDFKIAALFAFRRSPISALHDEKDYGVVLEYEISSPEGKDWVRAKESGVLQDEQEIAVFRVSALKLKAVHCMENSDWVRRNVSEVAR